MRHGLHAMSWIVAIAGRAPGQSIEVAASEDTTITVHPDLGGSGSNHDGDMELWAIGSSGYDSRPLVRFDLSAWAGWTVTGSTATVGLFLESTFHDAPVVNTVQMHSVSQSDWASSSATWDNFTGTLALLDSVVVTEADVGTYVTWQVPVATIQQWIDHPDEDDGLIFVSATATTHQDVTFASRERSATRAPLLTFDATRDASWSNYGAGFPGLNGVPSLTARAAPVIGTTLEVDVGSSAAATAIAVLLVGEDEASIPLRKGGSLLVDSIIVISLSLPPSGLTIAEDIDDDPTLVGMEFFAQTLLVDPGAARGLASSAGLKLVLGY